MQEDKEDFMITPHTDMECRIFAMNMVLNHFDEFYKSYDGVIDASIEVYNFITNNRKLLNNESQKGSI